MPVSAELDINRRYRGAIVRRRAVGAAVLLATVAAVFALWRLSAQLADTVTVRADVRDAAGLAAIGADVRVAGVPVGRITGVTRDGALARLTLALERDAGEVHRDATLALAPRLMFEGTAYAELTLGSPSAPPLGGGVIPASHTSTYVPLDDALRVLDAAARGNVRTIASAGATALSRHAPVDLAATVDAAPSLLAATATAAGAARGSHATELHSAVQSLTQVAAAVAHESPALTSELADAPPSEQALEVAGGRPLSAALAALPGTTTALRAGAADAAQVVSRLGSLLPQLEPGIAALPATLRAVRPLLRTAAPVLEALRPALGDASRALAGARGGAHATGQAIAALAPTLSILQDTLLSALERPTALGDPAYLAFLGLFAGGGGASAPFGVDGQGHFMRFGLRFLTGAGQPLPPCTLLAKVAPAVATLLASSGGCTP